jgi:hypothetical protein
VICLFGIGLLHVLRIALQRYLQIDLVVRHAIGFGHEHRIDH